MDEMEKDYQVVARAGANILRIQMAIIDADSSKPLGNVMSSVRLIGIGVVQYAKFS